MDDADILRAAAVLQAAALSLSKSDAMKTLYSSAKHFLNQQNRALNKCGIRLLREQRAQKRGGLIGGFLPPSVLLLPSAELAETETKTETKTKLISPQSCYICKKPYEELHHFYDRLCCACGDKNYAKRQQSRTLHGKLAIVTGGRIKIGFEVALKLLRSGANVVVTTRFAQDAQTRYQEADDYASFANRLRICELDMLNYRQLAAFAAFAAAQCVDILINNAAQTISRPSVFYETLHAPDNADNTARITCKEEEMHCFPKGIVDEHGTQVDYRPHNTWTTPLEETPIQELLDVTMINYFGPFILMQKLHRSFAANAYVINVTAVEGKFTCYKTGYHAHTNAAKAALNMLTRTIGELWAKQHIFVACVDTGWVTNEYPISAEFDVESKFHPPLDEIDGAARILDPIFCDLKCRGVFYKDYNITSW